MKQYIVEVWNYSTRKEKRNQYNSIHIVSGKYPQCIKLDWNLRDILGIYEDQLYIESNIIENNATSFPQPVDGRKVLHTYEQRKQDSIQTKRANVTYYSELNQEAKTLNRW